MHVPMARTNVRTYVSVLPGKSEKLNVETLRLVSSSRTRNDYVFLRERMVLARLTMKFMFVVWKRQCDSYVNNKV